MRLSDKSLERIAAGLGVMVAGSLLTVAGLYVHAVANRPKDAAADVLLEQYDSDHDGGLSSIELGYLADHMRVLEYQASNPVYPTDNYPVDN